MENNTNEQIVLNTNQVEGTEAEERKEKIESLNEELYQFQSSLRENKDRFDLRDTKAVLIGEKWLISVEPIPYNKLTRLGVFSKIRKDGVNIEDLEIENRNEAFVFNLNENVTLDEDNISEMEKIIEHLGSVIGEYEKVTQDYLKPYNETGYKELIAKVKAIEHNYGDEALGEVSKINLDIVTNLETAEKLSAEKLKELKHMKDQLQAILVKSEMVA